ncbi:MAG: histidine phosphatase family protein [Erysipelotrichales bacterium]|nr:histidine phosphatase family protein [Erysipelotrichales bacterium]
MKIYLVRHGEATSNLEHVYNRVDDELTELGIKQAETLANLVNAIDYDVVISSPLTRCIQTTNIINTHNKEVILDSNLKERDAGNLIGTPLENSNREEYWNYNTTLVQGEYEDIKDFFKRISNFLDELKKKDYKSVLIVSHSGVSKAINAYFNGIGDGYFLNKGLSNCEIKEYDL